MNYYIITKTKSSNGATYLVHNAGPTHKLVNGEQVVVPAPKTFGLVKVITAHSAPTQDTAAQLFEPSLLERARVSKSSLLYQECRNATLAIWNTFLDEVESTVGPGQRVYLEGQFGANFVAADVAAKSGDLAKAKAIIETVQVPAELQPTQAALAAAFSPFVTRAAALASATTVEQVEAV
jgi:hypothetical protein